MISYFFMFRIDQCFFKILIIKASSAIILNTYYSTFIKWAHLETFLNSLKICQSVIAVISLPWKWKNTIALDQRRMYKTVVIAINIGRIRLSLKFIIDLGTFFYKHKTDRIENDHDKSSII